MKYENKMSWTTIAKKFIEMYTRTEYKIKNFVSKYLLEGENVNILPQELKSKCTDEVLKRNGKFALNIQ